MFTRLKTESTVSVISIFVFLFTFVQEIWRKCSKNVVKEIYLNFVALLINLRLRKCSKKVVKQSYFEFPGAAFKRRKIRVFWLQMTSNRKISIRYVIYHKIISFYFSQSSSIRSTSWFVRTYFRSDNHS